MARQAKAVICREWNKPVSVETVTVESPRRGEVMIKIAACGVCHSDLSATNGTIPLPPPLVLGHEAAGHVAEVGEGVTSLAVGDRVMAGTQFGGVFGPMRTQRSETADALRKLMSDERGRRCRQRAQSASQ